MYDVIIVGGGLSGLIAFRQLLAAKLDVLLLEARPRHFGERTGWLKEGSILLMEKLQLLTLIGPFSNLSTTRIFESAWVMTNVLCLVII